MGRRFWCVSVIVLALMCGTARVAADPITAVYHVQVTDRQITARNPVWEPFSAEFTFRMTFDPANSVEDENGTYGPVSFSPVPLAVVPLPADEPLARNSYTSHGVFEQNPYGPDNLFAAATVDEVGSFPFSTYFRTLRLLSNVPPGDNPFVISAATFPAHLVLGEYPFYFGTRLIGTQGDQTLQYRGLATLQGVQAVPEPGTLALIAGGLILARLRLRPSGRRGAGIALLDDGAVRRGRL